MHSYLPNVNLNLSSNFNYDKLVKHETPSCDFAKVALARNVTKVSVYACLLKWVPKSTFKFHFSEKVNKSAYFKLLLDHPLMRAKIAPNLIKIGVHAYL